MRREDRDFVVEVEPTMVRAVENEGLRWGASMGELNNLRSNCCHAKSAE
jgi:hypothetical protein